MLGPYLSTNQASTGTSQVSVTTNIVKASWIAARPQWFFASIGSTNSVQPYWRFAIIAMQTMPMTSWSQRKPLEEGAAGVAAVVLETMCPPQARCPLRLSVAKVVTDRRTRWSDAGILYSKLQAN